MKLFAFVLKNLRRSRSLRVASTGNGVQDNSRERQITDCQPVLWNERGRELNHILPGCDQLVDRLLRLVERGRHEGRGASRLLDLAWDGIDEVLGDVSRK